MLPTIGLANECLNWSSWHLRWAANHLASPAVSAVTQALTTKVEAIECTRYECPSLR